MYFDTHAHIDDRRFDEDREELFKELPSRGISLMLNPGTDIRSSEKAIDYARTYEYVYAAVGFHPHDSKNMKDEDLNRLEIMALDNPKVVAVGEIGLDYHYDFSPREVQKKRFIQQLELAAKLKLPVIIHDREAHGDIMNILEDKKSILTGGVMHCYSGSWEMAERLLDLGFYISLAGPVTFKNAKRAVEVAERIPLDRLLIETDSPYLTPVPHRGKRNDPGYVKFVAEKIGELRGLSGEEVGRITKENGLRLFSIK